MLSGYPVNVNDFVAFFNCAPLGQAVNEVSVLNALPKPSSVDAFTVVLLAVCSDFQFEVQPLSLFLYSVEKLIYLNSVLSRCGAREPLGSQNIYILLKV